MPVTVGSGDHVYEVVEGWAKLPTGWEFTQVGGVAVDREDNVFVFNRSEHPVIVFDSDGNYRRSWGEGRFPCAHGMCFARDGSLWLVDSRDHTVKHFSAAGAHLQTLGAPDAPGADGEPFNRPTDVAAAPNGDLYISDGYGNSRVHVFDSRGEYLKSWGQSGVGPGDFNLPHNIWVHTDGRVLVSDRENHRIQIFDLDGKHLDTWTNFIQPTDIYVDSAGAIYVAELRNRITILDSRGRVLARWGRIPSSDPGMFFAPHAVWTDSRGDLYVGEVLEGQRVQKFIRK